MDELRVEKLKTGRYVVFVGDTGLAVDRLGNGWVVRDYTTMTAWDTRFPSMEAAVQAIRELVAEREN